MTRQNITRRLSLLLVTTLVAGLLCLGILVLMPGMPEPLADSPPTPTPQPTPVVASVFFKSSQELQQIAGKYDVWEVDHQQQRLVVQLASDQLTTLQQAGFRIDIDPAKTSELHTSHPRLPGQVSGIPGFPCYRTVEETHTDLAQLAAGHPDLAQWLDIGDSWAKTETGSGYDIFALALTNRTIPGPKPKFMLLSAVHARELTTAETATRFAEYLVANYGTDPDITWLLNWAEIHIIPQANPDGRKHAETGQYWRKNVDNDDGCFLENYWGVDLNRNGSFKWNECGGFSCSSGGACDETYRGPGPKSEPETQAIEDYVASIFPDQRGPSDTDPAPDDAQGVFITLHSYGQWVLFPWGYANIEAPNNTQLETLGRKFGYFTNYEVCQAGEPGCIYLTDGTNDDWAYGELGLAAYTFELGSAFFQACTYFEDTIIPDSFPALLYAFKAARRPYQTPAGPETLQVTASLTTMVAGMSLTLTVLADDTRYYSKVWGNEPVQPIAAVRYSVDGASWFTGAVTYPLSPVDGAFDSPVEAAQAVIDTTNWPPGRHLVLVESQDTAGNWGVPASVFVWVAEGIYVTPTEATQWVNAGETATYTLQLTAQTALSDTISILVSGNAWPTTAPPSVDLGIMGSSTFPLTVTVSVPISVAAGQFDIATVTFAPQGSHLLPAQAVLTTLVKSEVFLPVVQRQ